MQNEKKSDCAVIYTSKYGATKRYAEIIAKALSANLYDAQDNLNDVILKKYPLIIWGGGIYMGKINGMHDLVKNADQLEAKHIFVFSVGNTPAERQDLLNKVRENSISDKKNLNLSFFHFVARANFSDLTFADRLLLSVRRLSLLIKPKSSLTNGEQRFLDEYKKDLQVIDEKSTEGLIDRVQRLRTT